MVLTLIVSRPFDQQIFWRGQVGDPSPPFASPVDQHTQDGAEGVGRHVAVPPAGAVVAPFGLAGHLHRAVVHIRAAGVGGQEGETAFTLPLALNPHAVVLVEVETLFCATGPAKSAGGAGCAAPTEPTMPRSAPMVSV